MGTLDKRFELKSTYKKTDRNRGKQFKLEKKLEENLFKYLF